MLDQATTLGDGDGLVFPRHRCRPLSDTTLSLPLRRFGIRCVAQGFRSSFREWCSETGVAREVGEAYLAHVTKTEVEAMYAHSDLLERRRRVMEDWSKYVR